MKVVANAIYADKTFIWRVAWDKNTFILDIGRETMIAIQEGKRSLE